MKLLTAGFVLALAAIAALLIWGSPLEDSNKTSHHPHCVVQGKSCGNIVAWYKRGKTESVRRWTFVYAGKNQWLKTKGVGSIRGQGKFIKGTLRGTLAKKSKAQGGFLVYGPYGKKGRFRQFKNWKGGWAPLKRKLKTVKNGKKHWVSLTFAGLSWQSRAFLPPRYPVKGG